MFALISLVLALATPILQDSGRLAPDEQKVFDLSPKPGALTVTVLGDGRGDLDCYLIQNGRIVSRDENTDDRCDLQTVLKTNDTVRIWVRNNGTRVDEFTVNVGLVKT